MSIITDLYKQLFGRKGIGDGNVIDMAEHGRAGGISSGQGFKFVDNINYKQLIDDTGEHIYIGRALPNTSTSQNRWQIKRIDTNGNTLWADGNDNFDNVWDDRTSYNYS